MQDSFVQDSRTLDSAVEPGALPATSRGYELFAPISREIWERKYRLVRDGVAVDATVADTFARVASAAASVEVNQEARAHWARAYVDVMADFTFLPGGRILAGAGTDRTVTLFNCFVLGRIEDNLSSIFDNVREAALTMQAGGGIGHDFSTLRPRHALVRSVGADASGPTSFMDVWDAMCRTIMSAGHRRGAMMATLRCDHPDILEFIAAKAEPGRLRNFNLSVLVTDAFIAAVKTDADWPLVFEGTVYKTLPARDVWSAMTRSNYAYAEPGVIFIDRVNTLNNLAYCEEIVATNPCGEQPLPPYGACLLGSVNLARLVIDPFTPRASLDTARLSKTVAVAVRFLDSIIDVSRYPLPAQEREAKTKRRIGLGITGLADALIMLGLPYGGDRGRTFAAQTTAAIQADAYAASAELALEKGAFPAYDRDAILSRPNLRSLPAAVRELVATHGLRNGCLTSIAPTGTISLLAGNVSSGIEPVFELSYRRNVRGPDGAARSEPVEDYAYRQWLELNPGATPPRGDVWTTAHDLTPRQHLAMQAALQPHIDSAISKTINCPVDIEPAVFDALYLEAYDLGLKGCTTFRPNAVTGSVLMADDASTPVAPTASTATIAAASTPLPMAVVTNPSAAHPSAAHPPGHLTAGPQPTGLTNSHDCPVCASPRTRLDGSCQICLDCGQSLCG